MHFPNDQALREQAYAIDVIGRLKNAKPPAEVPWDVAATLHDAAIQGKIRRLTKRAQSSGRAAGFIYRVLVQCVFHEPEYASVNAAIAVTGRLIPRLITRKLVAGDTPFSPATLKAQWSSHKNVAHLWTAAHLAEENVSQSGVHDWRTSKQGLLEMLALSEALRDVGKKHRPHGRRTPTLNPTETWRPPDKIVLPTVETSPADIEPEIRAIIEEDRALRRVPTG